MFLYAGTDTLMAARLDTGWNDGRHTYFIHTSFEGKEASPHIWDKHATGLRIVFELGPVPGMRLAQGKSISITRISWRTHS